MLKNPQLQMKKKKNMKIFLILNNDKEINIYVECSW